VPGALIPAARLALLAAVALPLGACNLAEPEVVVVNRVDEHVLLRNVGFNGCLWSGVLAFGEATAPGDCLPGTDRVHFEKLDVRTPCADDGAPMWFAYQTVSVKRVDYGDFRIFEITLDDLEQDFSVPGPYGH
jgi:hypothetical protein